VHRVDLLCGHDGARACRIDGTANLQSRPDLRKSFVAKFPSAGRNRFGPRASTSILRRSRWRRRHRADAELGIRYVVLHTRRAGASGTVSQGRVRPVECASSLARRAITSMKSRADSWSDP
jgi:hypothetical protein